MAKQLSGGFDDSVEEHDSFDVELAEASHDDSNFDAELVDADQHEHATGNGGSTIEDPVLKFEIYSLFSDKNATNWSLESPPSVSIFDVDVMLYLQFESPFESPSQGSSALWRVLKMFNVNIFKCVWFCNDEQHMLDF
jgi:hypothetical protein